MSKKSITLVIGLIQKHYKINAFKMRCYRRRILLRIVGILIIYRTTENWCKGKNYDLYKQPVSQTDVLCDPHNEKHIRALLYSVLKNNRRKTVNANYEDGDQDEYGSMI